MHVPRKPTPLGRESHTTTCVETGAIIFFEFYEGADRMANKEYVRETSKSTSVVLRCNKPWHHTDRCLILDACFGSFLTTKACEEKGLFVIADFMGAHSKFSKSWLVANAPERGVRSMASTTFKTSSGEEWSVMGPAHRDK